MQLPMRSSLLPLVMLLVHGSSSTMKTWDRVAALLRRNYRVIRYDIPGMGLSGDVPDAAKARAAMAKVRAPTLLIWGGSDQHFPPIETPGRFTRIVQDWIEAAVPAR